MQAQMEMINERVEGEVSCLRELLSLLDEERDILLKGSHTDLMGTTERKLSLFHRLNQSQEERRRLQRELATAEDPQPSLTQLSRHLPSREQGPFRQRLSEADDLVRRVLGANQSNQGFVQEALATVDHLLGLLSGGGISRGYSPHGAVPAAPNRARLLTKEV